jgi:DNA-binding NtrC family response regulator
MPGDLSAARCDVLLIAADWQSRALLLAELQGEGYEVRAVPGLCHALRALVAGRVQPRLILIDVHEDPDAAPGPVEQIVALVPDIPVLLIAGAYDEAAWQPLRDRFAGILRRPLTVGQVAEAVRLLLTEPF